MPSATEWRLRFPNIWLWRARQESNPRPDGPKPSALSAELRARVSRSNRAENQMGIVGIALRAGASASFRRRAPSSVWPEAQAGGTDAAPRAGRSWHQVGAVVRSDTPARDHIAGRAGGGAGWRSRSPRR